MKYKKIIEIIRPTRIGTVDFRIKSERNIKIFVGNGRSSFKDKNILEIFGMTKIRIIKNTPTKTTKIKRG